MAGWKCAVFELCGKSIFSGVSLAVLHLRFISTGSLKFVVYLLKHTSREDIGSKSYLILITSFSLACVFRLWFGKQGRPTSVWNPRRTNSSDYSLANARFSSFTLCYDEVKCYYILNIIIWIYFKLSLIRRCRFFCVVFLCFLFSFFVPNMLLILIKLRVL